MSIILKYKCGCQYYSEKDKPIEPAHLCTKHKIEVFNDSLKTFVTEGSS